MPNWFAVFIIFFISAIVISTLVIKPESITTLPQQIGNITQNIACRNVTTTFFVDEPTNYTPKFNFLGHSLTRTQDSSGNYFYTGKVTIQNSESFNANFTVNYTFNITFQSSKLNTTSQTSGFKSQEIQTYFFVVNVSRGDEVTSTFAIIPKNIAITLKVNKTNTTRVCG